MTRNKVEELFCAGNRVIYGKPGEKPGEKPRLHVWHCAHCGEDIAVAGRPDAGGECPTCHRPLCRRCAGGWC